MGSKKNIEEPFKGGFKQIYTLFFLRNLFHKSAAQSVCVYMCVLKSFAQSTIIIEEVMMLDLSWQGISLSTRAI